ncbi:hypothetical protein AMJ83_05310 [candidate division WOR_3 bacterium SM23_42]|uniref:Peptidase M28 domain-containing protein n=1 Tax=candidate division WOR_3 bacterium SM23_42 TaxID=1703779 RepID=A0A0S8FVF9_UNCW3|nr:MAG: hypothetical protein AMJ83_05310 [candidate division WOR_3 bacterium SM23_42]
MLKNMAILIMFTIILGLGDTHLVRVELTEQRLTPLAENGLRIIGELEHCAFILADDSEFDDIGSQNYEILDTNPRDGDYYLVHTVDQTLNLTEFGDILTQGNENYLLRVGQNMLEPLLKQKVMLKRLTFTPKVLRDETLLPPVFFNYTVQEMVNLVDADSIFDNVQRLQDYVTRYSTHDSCFAAADYIADKFNTYGCDSVYFQYHTAGHAPNVIGIKHGSVYPDSIYAVICGHFDATSYLAPDIAPGADDNASGTAAVIEAVRVMNGYEFDRSIRYIAFSGEEFGLYGSEYYAQLAHSQGDSILGVLNSDMIAYADMQPETLEVIAKISNPNCEPFADFFIAAADTYTTLLSRKRMTYSMVYSDHAPFWDNGYLALCSIEDWYVVNPYYHTPGDTIGAGYNDHAFCTEVTKAEIATLALLANPVGTGVEEYTETAVQNLTLNVHPNISNGHFTFTINNNQSGNALDIQIYDALGRVVKNMRILDQAAWNGTDDSGRILSEGIYFVGVAGKSKLPKAKIVLLR